MKSGPQDSQQLTQSEDKVSCSQSHGVESSFRQDAVMGTASTRAAAKLTERSLVTYRQFHLYAIHSPFCCGPSGAGGPQPSRHTSVETMLYQASYLSTVACRLGHRLRIVTGNTSPATGLVGLIDCSYSTVR